MSLHALGPERTKQMNDNLYNGDTVKHAALQEIIYY